MLIEIEKIINNFNISPLGVIHVGAHHGQEYKIYEKLNIKNIVMFEPSLKNFNILKENLKNKNVELVNSGLSSKNECIEMHVESMNEGQSNSVLKPKLHVSQYPHIKFENKEVIKLITLDDWMNQNPSFAEFNIMSVDVQGYELEVFLGAKNTLKNIDLIVCEVNRAELYENCAYVTEIDIFLKYHNFRRVATNWAGNTWGDAVYIKEDTISKSCQSVNSINLIDNNFKHSKNILGFDSACLLPTARLNWNREGNGNSNFVILTDECLSQKTTLPKVAWILEPKVLSNAAYQHVEQNENNFQKIISHDIDFLSKIKNGIYAPYGGSWISPNEWNNDFKKSKNVSIIASKKNITFGHKLRHKAAKLLNPEDRFGEAYNPVSNKIDALSDYRFSIVVENSDANGYFSEKLIDCLICKTIPIYWGSKNIFNFFEKDGILFFENDMDLESMLNSIDFESFYNDKLKFVEINAKRARRFSSVDENLFSSMLGIC